MTVSKTDITIDRAALESLPANGQSVDALEGCGLRVYDRPTKPEPSTPDDVAAAAAPVGPAQGGATGPIAGGDDQWDIEFCVVPQTVNAPSKEDVIRKHLGSVASDASIAMPAQGDPLSELKTDGLLTKCFPCLFPDGKGDPTNVLRGEHFHERITLCEAFKHLVKFAEKDSATGEYRYRFAANERFMFYSYDLRRRHSALDLAKVYQKKHPNASHMTVDDLRVMMADDSKRAALLAGVETYIANVPNTTGYWKQRRRQLLALFAQEGPGTVFWTVSAADNHWDDLHRHISPAGSSFTARHKNVVANPHIVDAYFHHRVQALVKHLFEPVLGNKADGGKMWHWWRYEWQSRGSIHAHGTTRLDADNPNTDFVSMISLAKDGCLAGIELSLEFSLREQLERMHADESAPTDRRPTEAMARRFHDARELAVALAGEREARCAAGLQSAWEDLRIDRICRGYGSRLRAEWCTDWYISTWNDNGVPTVVDGDSGARLSSEWDAPSVHPSGVPMREAHSLWGNPTSTMDCPDSWCHCASASGRGVPPATDADRPSFHRTRRDLQNSVMRHKEHRLGYCWRKGECRFHFPHRVVRYTTIKFAVKDRMNVAPKCTVTLETARNDPAMNSANDLQLVFWMGNCDMQVILDEDRAAEYMAKYTAKAEKMSKTVEDTLVDLQGGKLRPRSAPGVASGPGDEYFPNPVSRAFIAGLGETDAPLQVCAHYLLGLPFEQSTHQFAHLKWDQTSRVLNTVDTSEARRAYCAAQTADGASNVPNPGKDNAFGYSVADAYARRMDFSRDVRNVIGTLPNKADRHGPALDLRHWSWADFASNVNVVKTSGKITRRNGAVVGLDTRNAPKILTMMPWVPPLPALRERWAEMILRTNRPWRNTASDALRAVYAADTDGEGIGSYEGENDAMGGNERMELDLVFASQERQRADAAGTYNRARERSRALRARGTLFGEMADSEPDESLVGQNSLFGSDGDASDSNADSDSDGDDCMFGVCGVLHGGGGPPVVGADAGSDAPSETGDDSPNLSILIAWLETSPPNRPLYWVRSMLRKALRLRANHNDACDVSSDEGEDESRFAGEQPAYLAVAKRRQAKLSASGLRQLALDRKIRDQAAASTVDYQAEWLKVRSDGERGGPTATEVAAYRDGANTLSWKRRCSGVHRKAVPAVLHALEGAQADAVRVIQSHAKDQSPTRAPLHMIVTGTAGSGKSTVLRAMFHAVEGACGPGACALSATTGMAGFNIQGSTIHSLCGLMAPGDTLKEGGAKLRTLRRTLQGVQYIVVDEMSMLDHSLLYLISRRLQQVHAVPHGDDRYGADEPFGGVGIILVGDFGQLPPVVRKGGGRSLYRELPACCGFAARSGRALYLGFRTVVCLSKVYRQHANTRAQQAFAVALLNARNGLLSKVDVELLKTRSRRAVLKGGGNLEQFDLAPRLFYSNSAVDEENSEQLAKLATTTGVPIVGIQAHHSEDAAAAGSAKDARGLVKILYLAVGARVMVTQNLWTLQGVVNGSPGVVKAILYDCAPDVPGGKPRAPALGELPVAVIVELDRYDGPCFFGDDADCRRWVAINPFIATWGASGGAATADGVRKATSSLSRTQFPLRLRWAMTIHKSQGQTLDAAVIDLGVKEGATGMTFVALSRLRDLATLLLELPAKGSLAERLYRVNRSSTLVFRRNEDKRLQALHDARSARTPNAGGSITVLPVRGLVPVAPVVAPVAAAAAAALKQTTVKFIPAGVRQLRPLCKCGSTAHQRTSSKSCPLNPNKSAKRRRVSHGLAATSPSAGGNSNTFVPPSCKCGSTTHQRTSSKSCSLHAAMPSKPPCIIVANTPRHAVGVTSGPAAATSKKRRRVEGEAERRLRRRTGRAGSTVKRPISCAGVLAEVATMEHRPFRTAHARARAILTAVGELEDTRDLHDDTLKSFVWAPVKHLLENGRFINAHIMDWYIRIVRRRSRRGRAPTPVILKTAMFTQAMFSPAPTRSCLLFAVLRSDADLWKCLPAEMRNLSATGRTLVPVNVFNSHWILLEIIDPGSAGPSIVVYDPTESWTNTVFPVIVGDVASTRALRYNFNGGGFNGPFSVAQYKKASRVSPSASGEDMTTFFVTAAKRWVTVWRENRGLCAAAVAVRRAECPQQCAGSCACGPYVLKMISLLQSGRVPARRSDSSDDSVRVRLDVFDVLAAP